MMKPATMERAILSINASIRVLHGTLMELQISVLEIEARLGARAPDPGLEVGQPTSPPRRPAGPEDEAGGP